jgi:phosphotransferase system HPr (HPr) family protein
VSGTAKRSARVADPLGFHARSCTAIVLLAKRHRAEIRIAHGDQDADAREVFDLMMMNVPGGAVVEGRATGAAADAAAAAMATLIETAPKSSA